MASNFQSIMKKMITNTKMMKMKVLVKMKNTLRKKRTQWVRKQAVPSRNLLTLSTPLSLTSNESPTAS
jgi:7-cyano-7-deazaguanine synthase in queuosine biosynthesis